MLGLFCRAEQSDSGISSRAIGGDEITGIGHSVLMAVSLLSPIPQHYKWPGCGLRDASAVIQRKKAVRGLKCLETRPSFRLCGDPLLGFGLALEPANVLILAARMPCEHMPFIPQLDGLSDYRRGRLGERAPPVPDQSGRASNRRSFWSPHSPCCDHRHASHVRSLCPVRNPPALNRARPEGSLRTRFPQSVPAPRLSAKLVVREL